MKKILMLASLLVLFAAVPAQAEHQPGAQARFDVFYSNLSGYGEWVDCNFGYAWRPRHVALHWRPYMMGRWMWTDYGWYWYSNEPFGWATYHYGRWIYDDYYGWIWIPDDVWGPAWVEWRYDDDYIGWSPLPPYAVFDVNIGISYSRGWTAPVYYWNFVPYRNFTSVRVNDYVQPIERTRRIFGSTRGTVNIRGDANRVINGGVDINDVRRRGHIDIDRADIIHNDRSMGDRVVRQGGREKVEVFRPRIEGPASERGMQQREGVRSGAFDQPQHRNVQEEPQIRGQREGKPEARPQVQPQGRGQRDAKPEARPQVQPQGRGQRDAKPEARPQVQPQGRGQRGVKPEVQQQDQRRIEQKEQRQGWNRSEPMPQNRERMQQPQQRVSPPGGRGQERKNEQPRSQGRGRRPM